MNIEVSDVQELKKYMREQWERGCQWISFPAYEEKLRVSDLRAFKDFGSLIAFTSIEEGRFQNFKPIFNILRGLPAGDFKQKPVDMEKLANEIVKYPIQSFHPSNDLKAGLATGDLLPVLLNRKIDPVMEILDYKIYSHTHPGHQVYEIGHEVDLIGSFTNHEKAVGFFDQQINECSIHAYRFKPDLVMIAVFKHQNPELDVEGMPLYNSAMLLKTANPLYDGGQRQQAYETKDWQDIHSLEIKQPVLAKFNTQNSELEFFNGELQKVSPVGKIDYMPLEGFSTRKVHISETQKQTIRDEDVHRHQQKTGGHRL